MAESRSRTKDISATILLVYGCRRCYYRQKGKETSSALYDRLLLFELFYL